MMPQSGNLDPNQGAAANSGSSLLGSFLTSPGSIMAGYDQVPGAGDLASSASRLFSRENLRPLREMMGSGEAKPFSLLLNPGGLLDRLRHNMMYFYLNYMTMTAVLFVLNVFFSPTAWIGILILAVMWIGMINSIQEERTLKLATGGMTLFSAFVLWYLLGGAFKWTLYLSGFLTLGHALFRDSGSMQVQQTHTDPMIIPSDAGFYQGPQIVSS